jgi:hypothetical protein
LGGAGLDLATFAFGEQADSIKDATNKATAVGDFILILEILQYLAALTAPQNRHQ